MDIIPDKRKIVELVEQAHQGKLCLPDFQRDFVWTREQVADLLRSMIRLYYIGALLLLRCDPQKPPFAPVYFRGASPFYKDPQPELLVLDGQQRLTALLYALATPALPLKDSSERRWFFVDLDLLVRDPYDDEIIFDRSPKELDGLDQQPEQYKRHILPCTCLLSSKQFLAWRDGLDDWLRENRPNEHRVFREEWRDLWTKAVTDFQSYLVALVELPRVEDSDSEAIGRVCAIFEKLNSTGEELSVYDLLTARLYRYGIKLHDLWKLACNKHKLLNSWSKGKAETSKFGVLILRTLALLRGLDPKPRILIDLKPEQFKEDWQDAAAAMERALELLTLVGADGFGVFNPKWIPGYGLLPILAALRAEIEKRQLDEGPRSDLRRWYWSNVFLERYSSAVESKSRKDYVEMLAHWASGGSEPSVFAEARARIGAPGYTVRDTTSRASSIYSGIFCLLANRGARDWRRGESIQLQELHDHHIFPRKYLSRHEIKAKGDLNTVVNRTLISNETNQMIKDRAPAEYIADKKIFPSGASGEILDPHFIGSTGIGEMRKALEALSKDELAVVYDAFLKDRDGLLPKNRTS